MITGKNAWRINLVIFSAGGVNKWKKGGKFYMHAELMSCEVSMLQWWYLAPLCLSLFPSGSLQAHASLCVSPSARSTPRAQRSKRSFSLDRLNKKPFLQGEIISEDFSRASTRKICPKWGPRKSHGKATENAQTLFFQADEGHVKATEKPRKSNE